MNNLFHTCTYKRNDIGANSQTRGRTEHFFSGVAMIFVVMTSCFFVLTSCKKLVEVPAPSTSITQANVYSDDGSAISVLTGLYTQFSFDGGGFTGQKSFSILCGLSADELTLWNGVANQSSISYYKNALALNNKAYYGEELWAPCYKYIFTCNSVIEGVNSPHSTLSAGVKKQILGEARFCRAFCYFYLINLFGDVPLVLSTDYTETAKMSRTPSADVYKRIVNDLNDAKAQLSNSYLTAGLNDISAERVRPTSWAATALLARVYLYMKDYANAEAQATAVIANSTMFSLSTLNSAFLRAGQGNNEAIWQIQSTGVSGTLLNTWDGNYFIVPTTGPNTTQSYFVSNGLYSSFEAGDNRKTSWVATYGTGTAAVNYPFKYKLGSQSNGAASSEYSMVLRLAEQYLIRAEARAQLGTNLTGAAADLNVIRTRAGLANTTANTQTTLMAAVLRERQIELFSEWGHRWLDLKRTGTVDAVMGNPGGACAAKGGTWVTTQQLYPLPFGDLQKNTNLVQNAGY